MCTICNLKLIFNLANFTKCIYNVLSVGPESGPTNVWNAWTDFDLDFR